MDLGIAGRKAIVCASSRGLGRACAEALAQAGCEVVINGLDATRLETTATEIRKATGLTQAKFAALIDVHLGTLRNWEQGRRDPTGPAKALLKAIHNDPVNVLNALAD